MGEKTIQRMGWLVAIAVLVLTAVIAISGAPRVDARVPEISKSSAAPASIEPGEARADTDTCDLQLD